MEALAELPCPVMEAGAKPPLGLLQMQTEPPLRGLRVALEQGLHQGRDLRAVLLAKPADDDILDEIPQETEWDQKRLSIEQTATPTP